MAHLKTQSEFLFIGRGDDSFLENYSYELESNVEEGGRLFISLEISNNQAEAEEIAETVFATMKGEFYRSLEQEAYTRFEEAIKVVNKKIDEFKEEKVSRFIGNLNIIIGVLHGDALYVTSTGDAEGYLVRRRQVTIVSEGLNEKKDGDAFENIASGNVEKGDMIVLSSSRLLRYITKNEFGRIFSARDKDGAAETALAELQDIMTTEILGKVAVAAIYAEDKMATEGDAEEVEGKESGAEGMASRFKKIKSLFRWERRGKSGGGVLASVLSKMSLRDYFKDRVLMALFIVIVLLLGSIFWLRTRGNQEQLIADLEAKLTHVQEVVNDAATQGQFDKDRGALLLQQAEKEALEVLNSRFLRAKASTLLDEIERQRALLDNVKRIQNPTLFADLTVKNPTVNLIGFDFLIDRLIAFEHKTLFEILLSNVKDPLSINETEEVILATSFADKSSMVFLTRSGKAIEYRDGLFSFADTPDGTFKRGVDMKSYNDKVYILDPERNQIWRYKSKRTGYDAGEAYNKDGDVSKAVAFAIDSSIYVLNGDGTMGLLYAGEKKDFSIIKAPLQKVEKPTKIFTSDNLNQLFILEPGKSRVLVYTKDFKQGGAMPSGAVYTTQYVFENVGELVNMYVSRDENKLYVMTSQKIYVTPLN